MAEDCFKKITKTLMSIPTYSPKPFDVDSDPGQLVVSVDLRGMKPLVAGESISITIDSDRVLS